ncbi:MAG: Ldh family oxidoreductase [Patescibacteria group bacterium]
MKISIEELRSLLKQAASKYVSEDESNYFAIEQVDTMLKKQPRSGSFKDVLSDIKAWRDHEGNKIEIEAEKPASLLLNFHSLGPSLKLKYIHDQAESRAKQNGISLIGINHGGVHTLNLWTDGLGKRDMISIFMYNGGPEGVVPFGGTRGLFGTNPISYAIPTNEKPIIVDMATSDIPYFEISDAKKENRQLKPGVAVDKFGKMTTNPKEALLEDGTSNLLPLGGGYKGYAIVLLAEILTGSLVRSLLSTEMSSDYIVEEHGGLLITIDIGSFTDITRFKKSVSEMCQEVRSQKPAEGVEQVTIPGDRNYKKVDLLLRRGTIDLDEEQIAELRELAAND